MTFTKADRLYHSIRHEIYKTHLAREQHKGLCDRRTDDDVPDLNSWDLSDKAARNIMELIK